MEAKQNLPKPFLGRALIEALHEDVEAYMKEKAGVSKDSIIQLPDSYKSKHSVPLKKGKIIETAPDFGGESFRNKCGDDVGYVPKVGDIVWFVPNETFAVDIDRKYHLLNDCDIVGYERGTENVE